MALGGDDVADGDAGAADVVEIAVADAEVERAGASPSPAAAHGVSQPVRPLPSRNTCVGTMPRAHAEPLGGARGERGAVAAGHDVLGGDPLRR